MYCSAAGKPVVNKDVFLYHHARRLETRRPLYARARVSALAEEGADRHATMLPTLRHSYYLRAYTVDGNSFHH